MTTTTTTATFHFLAASHSKHFSTETLHKGL